MAEDQEALGLALQALGRKERSVAELGTWLRERGVADEELSGVVDQLVETGVLDDERFARRYAEDKRELSGWGSDRIRSALLERGIDYHDAEAALALEDSSDELDRATQLLVERRRPLEDERERTRALGFLIRRGYEAELAYEAIRRARPA